MRTDSPFYGERTCIHTRMTTFIHLHVHTEFSLVDGLIRIKPLLNAVRTAEMPAVAITDAGNLFAAIKFYQAALKAGIKPIIGAEVVIQRASEMPSRLVLLCQNLIGYHNLMHLLSRAYLESQPHESSASPRIQVEWLENKTAGLIALSAGRDGEIGRILLNGSLVKAQAILAKWHHLFPQRFYLEIQRTGRPQEEELIQATVELAIATHTPIVATNDVRFLNRDEFIAHEVRVCIQEGYTLNDLKRPKNYSDQQYLRSPKEMAELFADLPEALENSVEIARRCNLELTLGKPMLPEFPIPEGKSVESYFRECAQQGLEVRLTQLAITSDTRRIYLERLQHELTVICQMGFPGYFLIVADFIQWAKQNNIPVGPGRGSGAGSLVAYCLGITDLDPIFYNLLFERFLNPERVSMPDFDIDFCMEKRDRVIEYVANRYGHDKVAQIATHGTMAAKAVVRDVGRVLGHHYGFVDRIAKLIPFELGITLDKALAQEPELKKLYENDEEVRRLIDMGRTLEGLARNVGKHAGGVVIAPSQLTDFSPLYRDPDSPIPITQYDKDDVESVGLVKFDFLGLRNLTIIDWTLDTINQQRRRKGEAPFDLSQIDLQDQKAFSILKKCQTTAVFQLESRGIKDLIRRLQPDSFEDIVALMALYRPGPLQSGMVDDFIERKHGRAAIEYPHPDLAPILQSTYGVILYQEQVMQIAQVLANYTLGGADILRRAMGKKKPEEMAKQRAIFLEGARQRQVDEAVAHHIFDLMDKFAGYGFNRSHSAAYALVSYQTAWLKAYYPAAFMAAVLSSDMDKTDKVVHFLEDCRALQLAIIPPDINRSEYRFTVTDQNQILYGLGAIKGLGEAAVEALVQERRQNGCYRDLADLCRRVDLHKVNKRALEALIRCGACDSFGLNRPTLLAHLPDVVRTMTQVAVNQVDMFGNATEITAPTLTSAMVADWDTNTRLAAEKETLGLYLSGHPVSSLFEEMGDVLSGKLAHFATQRSTERQSERLLRIAGLITEVRKKKHSNGGQWAIVTLADDQASLEVRVFSEVYQTAHAHLNEGQVIIMQGKIAWDGYAGKMQMTAEAILPIEEARQRYAKRLELTLTAQDMNAQLISQLAQLLTPYQNKEGCSIEVHYRNTYAFAKIRFGERWHIKLTSEVLSKLYSLLDAAKVKVIYTAQRHSSDKDYNPQKNSVLN